jgi:soluble lytic murein transglycosylase-like protein
MRTSGRESLTAFGAAAIAALVLAACADLPHEAPPGAPTAEFVGPPAPEKRAASTAPKHVATLQEKKLAYSKYLRRNFKVDAARAGRIIDASWSAGAQFKLEPSLLLAIMAVESSYDPRAFNGTDMGLMQVNPHLHAKKVAKVGGGEQALYEIDKNVYVGAWVLREIRNHSASMRDALLHYSGASHVGRTYPDRVEAYRLALERAIRV